MAGASDLDPARDDEPSTARLRRRAAELEALFSTARELVRLQDVDEILSRLVERAHGLMGTDVTYLSEIEPGGDLRVRHSVGTVTAEFRDLWVPAGFGLASMVVRTRAPVWVPRYEAMEAAPHDARIDAAVAAEGLVAFLGVPMTVGDEVLGALFACNRVAYDFAPEEVLLLSAFADHAAAVLRTARLLADADAAKARAEAAYRELEGHVAATELAGAIHEELISAVMSGGSVIDIVATLSRRLDRRVWALDDAGRPLRVHDDSTADLPRGAPLAGAVAQSRASGHAELLVGRGRSWLVAAILGADRMVGAIVAEAGGTLPDDVGRRTLERAAHVAALVSFQQEAVSAARAERRAQWLVDALEGRDATGAGDVGWTPPTRLSGCAVIDLAGRGSAHGISLAVRAVGEDGVAALRDGRVVVAWTVDDVLAATERVRRVVAETLAEPTVTAVALAREHEPAATAGAVVHLLHDLDLLRALGVSGATVSSDAFSPYHALAPSDPAALKRFVDDLLGPVLTWDERRGTRLFETLVAYFDHGESRSAVAATLHVHTNTVQQRLDRIRALLPGDLTDPEHRFRVQAAVRLEHLRRTLRADAARSR